jgi:hypothetical protein
MELKDLIRLPLAELENNDREEALRYLLEPDELEVASAGWHEDELQELLGWLGAILADRVDDRAGVREAAAEHFHDVHARVRELHARIF